jgi:outer membrane protein OmpA-like peptidoglycan-associated protein
MRRSILFLFIISNFIICEVFIFSNANGRPLQSKTILIIDEGVTNLPVPQNIQKFQLNDQGINSNILLEQPPLETPRSVFLGSNNLLKKPELRTQKIKLKQPTLKTKRRLNLKKLSTKKNIRKQKIKTDRRLLADNLKPSIKKTKITKIAKINTLPEVKKKKSAPKNLPVSPKAIERKPVRILEAPPPPAKTIEAFDKKITKNQSATKQIESPQQLASINSKDEKEGGARSLMFSQGGAKLSNESKKVLDLLSLTFSKQAKIRMQLLAYAGEPNLTASKARRLSLSRALAVRSYLIKKGVRSTRIDVRALGNKTNLGAPNRVELKIIKD